METIKKNQYKTIIVHGRQHVVKEIKRQEFRCSSYIWELKDGKWVARCDENGKEITKSWIIEAPAYLGMQDLVLCGVLNKNETLKQWINKYGKK